MKKSIAAAGLDPDNLPEADKTKMNFGSSRERPKAWKTIWGAGQGVGNIDDVPAVRDLVGRLQAEYAAARARLGVAAPAAAALDSA